MLRERREKVFQIWVKTLKKCWRKVALETIVVLWLLELLGEPTLDTGWELWAPAAAEACKREFKRNIICIFVGVWLMEFIGFNFLLASVLLLTVTLTLTPHANWVELEIWTWVLIKQATRTTNTNQTRYMFNFSFQFLEQRCLVLLSFVSFNGDVFMWWLQCSLQVTERAWLPQWKAPWDNIRLYVSRMW